MRAIDPSGFPEQRALDRRLLLREIERELREAPFTLWRSPVSQQNGPHLWLAVLPSFVSLETADDVGDYITRLRSVPAMFAGVTESMHHRPTRNEAW